MAKPARSSTIRLSTRAQDRTRGSAVLLTVSQITSRDNKPTDSVAWSIRDTIGIDLNNIYCVNQTKTFQFADANHCCVTTKMCSFLDYCHVAEVTARQNKIRENMYGICQTQNTSSTATSLAACKDHCWYLFQCFATELILLVYVW